MEIKNKEEGSGSCKLQNMKIQEQKICSLENYETKGLLLLIDETSYRKSFIVYACENAYL